MMIPNLDSLADSHSLLHLILNEREVRKWLLLLGTLSKGTLFNFTKRSAENYAQTLKKSVETEAISSVASA